MHDELLQRTSITEDDWCRGPRDAHITILEYGDFECPYCGAAYPVLGELLDAHPDTLRLVFRHFPVTTSHPHAATAAEAAEAAGAQGRFWAMHDLIFTHQQQLEFSHLRSYAMSAGCDLKRFDREMEAGTYADEVKADVRRGIRDGVNGTPTLFINGTRYDGPRDYDSLSAAISSVGAGVV